MEITVKLRFLRMAPRKVRAIARVIKGLTIREAKTRLTFAERASAEPLLKLLISAEKAAGEKFKSVRDFSEWKISKLLVDEGPKFKRQIYFSRGRAALVMKKMSHVTLVIASPDAAKIKKAKEKV